MCGMQCARPCAAALPAYYYPYSRRCRSPIAYTYGTGRDYLKPAVILICGTDRYPPAARGYPAMRSVGLCAACCSALGLVRQLCPPITIHIADVVVVQSRIRTGRDGTTSVRYTHLTLPTICSV